MRSLCLLLLGLPLTALAGAPQGLDKLAVYAGSWKTDIRFLDTPFSKAGEDKHGLKNDCWRSAGYYACDQIVDGDSKALIIYQYDKASDLFSSYVVPAGGIPELRPGSLKIAGAVWTFPWDQTEGGKTTHFKVVNTWGSPDHIQFRQEYSADGTHWTLMGQGDTLRVKP